VRTLDDLKGKRVRAPGGGWARTAEYLGMVPVNIPFTEIYTSLERGAVDCVLTDATNLTTGVTVVDLTKSVLMMPFQPGYNTSQLTMNLKFWRERTNAERRMMLNESAIVMAKSHIVFDQVEASALQTAKAKGVQIVEPDATLKAAYGKWVADGFGGVTKYARERLKIAEPEKVMAAYQTAYLDKWTALLKGVDRTNQAAVVAALRTHLFDKIDVATVGMK
jgi:TRAP-type transport system periplasmic protein